MNVSLKQIYSTIRRKLHSFTDKLSARLNRLERSIAEKIKSGKTVIHAVDETMAEQRFANGLLKDTQNTMAEMAAAGHGIGNANDSLDKQRRKIIINKLTHFMWAPDEMPLSERIHGSGNKIRQEIVDVISASIRNAETVKNMAMKLYGGYGGKDGALKPAETPRYLQRMKDLAMLAASGDKRVIKDLEKAIASAEKHIKKLETNELRAAYKNLLDVCENKRLKEKLIERAAYVAVQEKTRYHAMRIARTESQRAWFQGLIAKHQDDPLVFGYRWALSSRHKHVPFDMCDAFANMDVGFGKGIYPKNFMPIIPLHPHCMCMVVPVFVSDVDKNAAVNMKKAREYFSGLAPCDRRRLFGADGDMLYRKGGDWQGLMRGWEGMKKPDKVLSGADFIE